MVDASGLGTVVMKIRHKRDLDTLFSALGGESGLDLTKDVTIGAGDDMDMIDAGKSLALVNKEAVKSADAAMEEIKKATGLIAADGKFQKTVKLAFFNMDAVNGACGDLTTKLNKQDEEKKKKEKEEAEAEAARLEAEQDAKDIGGSLSYYPSKRDWVEPDRAAADGRSEDSRYVAGGTPKCVAVTEEKTIKRDKTRPDWRPITKYMVGEPDKVSGDFKVYIEEPEVVSCDKSKISVEFRSLSYCVRVETGAEPLVLGPVECGQLDLNHSTWKLSPGKRLTISLVKARTNAQHALPSKGGNSKAATAAHTGEASATGEVAEKESSMSPIYMLLSFVPVFMSMWYFYKNQNDTSASVT